MSPTGARWTDAALAGGRRASAALLDLLLPPRCLACGTGVSRQGLLCGDCWSAVTFIAEPLCDCCGLPFELGTVPGSLCAGCSARRPAFDRARAAVVYDDGSRDLILRLKHADATENAATLAAWMLRAGRDLVEPCDLVAPVPLHWRRLIARRYNQSALLARAVAREAGKPWMPDLLVRRRATPSQGGLSAVGRRRNLAGAIAVKDAHRAAIAGRRVLVVDDVHTTGATLDACASALKRAGAAVDCLTFARVLRT